MKNPSNPLQLAEMSLSGASSSAASSAPVLCRDRPGLVCELTTSDSRFKAAELELVLSDGDNRIVRGKSNAGGCFTFSGLTIDTDYILVIESKNWSITGDSEYGDATDTAARWEDGPPSTGQPAAGIAVKAGRHYTIRVDDFLTQIELIFLQQNRAAHAARDVEYSLFDRDRQRLIDGAEITDDGGAVRLVIPRHAFYVITSFTTLEGRPRYAEFLLDGQKSAADEYMRKHRVTRLPIARGGSVEVVDPPQCVTPEGVQNCSYNDNNRHGFMERLIFGDLAALNLGNNFDSPMQANKYDVLTNYNPDNLGRSDHAKLRMSAFLRWPPPAVTGWQRSEELENGATVASGLIYISSGRADVIDQYLQNSPMIVWCIATGRCCDIVVDFTEFEAYTAAVKKALKALVQLVQGYAAKAGHKPVPDSDKSTQELKEAAAGTDAGKPGKPKGATQGGSSAPATSPATGGRVASSSSSGSGPMPPSGGTASQDSATHSEADIKAAHAQWAQHVRRRLRVVAPKPAGMERYPRGFGFNRHIGMLWMTERYTDMCAIVDDNTLGFEAATAESMAWLFQRNNIAGAVPAVSASSSSSSSKYQRKGDVKAGDWLAVAFKPCTETLSGRVEIRFDKAQYFGAVAPPVLQRCAGQNLFIQQLSVWNVKRYRELGQQYPELMNYDVNFVTGKEDIDFHSRLVNDEATKNLLFGTRDWHIVKCRFAEASASSSSSSATATDLKTEMMQQELAARIGLFSPCFRRLWTDDDTEALRLIEARLYGNGKTAPSALNKLELVKRINMVLEQIFVTAEKR